MFISFFNLFFSNTSPRFNRKIRFQMEIFFPDCTSRPTPTTLRRSEPTWVWIYSRWGKSSGTSPRRRRWTRTRRRKRPPAWSPSTMILLNQFFLSKTRLWYNGCIRFTPNRRGGGRDMICGREVAERQSNRQTFTFSNHTQASLKEIEAWDVFSCPLVLSSMKILDFSKSFWLHIE